MVEKTTGTMPLPAPLLATKCYIPRLRAILVRRPRLVTQLQLGLHCPLTVISAPAGFGKTTLLADWYAGSGTPGDEASVYRLAWVALDEGDNDPVRFWRYVATALENVQPGTGWSILPLLDSPQALSFDLVLTRLINALATDSSGDELLLALDDYHLIESPEIHEGMTFLLEHLPPQVHIIICSRISPPLPLARLRARSLLSEIGANDLRFTGDETPELLRRLLGESLPAASLATLEKQCEGWAAGLQLAALSLRGSPDIPARVAEFGGANRLVLEYVTEEVLRRQPASVQRFLLHTSILDRLSAPLCNAVTGDLDGQSMLETLEAKNLFLVPLDEQQQWFRYHHLFASLLRQRLQRTLPEAIPQLHQRAARWLQQHGLLSSAVEHALAGEEFSLAAQLIQLYFQTMLVRSEMNTVRRWLDTLPGEIRSSSADLSLIYAWVLLATGAFGAVEPYLGDVERALAIVELDTAPTAEAARSLIVRGHVAALRATAAVNSGHKELARELSLEALRILPAEETLPRTVASLSLADALSGENDLAAATQAFVEAYQTSLAAGMIPVTLNALGNLGQLYERQAKLHQAAATYEQALRLSAMHNAFQHFSSKSHIGMARVLREWGKLTQARAEAERGIDCAQRWGHQEHLIDGYLCLADIQWAEEDTAGALTTLAEAELLLFQPTAHAEAAARFAIYQASRWILLGQLDAAHRWAIGFDTGMEGDARQHTAGILTLARLRLVEGDPEAACLLLLQLLPIVERVGLTEDAIGIHILLALAEREAHRSAQAERELRQALALAEPEGYRRIFLDEGAPLQTLLETLHPGGAGDAYRRGLLADLRAASRGSHTPSPLLEPLTRREQEVLRLIAEGASNQDIAEALVIALGTVKKHITTIFAKVGVTSRTQLLARARDLGLIQL